MEVDKDENEPNDDQRSSSKIVLALCRDGGAWSNKPLFFVKKSPLGSNPKKTYERVFLDFSEDECPLQKRNRRLSQILKGLDYTRKPGKLVSHVKPNDDLKVVYHLWMLAQVQNDPFL